MASEAGAVTVAVLSVEPRIRTALRALLEADGGYAVSVASTVEGARALLGDATLAAVVVGLGSTSRAAEAALLRLSRQAATRPAVVVVGRRGGLDLLADPDAILAAAAEAVSARLADPL